MKQIIMCTTLKIFCILTKISHKTQINLDTAAQICLTTIAS